MSKEFIHKKLEQISVLITELEELLNLTFAEFINKFTNVRSAERNFQLIVELASDINTHISLELGKSAPDTYRQSFQELQKLSIIPQKIFGDLVKSANLRNILIHEYDFDEDNFIFYKSAKKFMPVYREYCSSIQKYLEKK